MKLPEKYRNGRKDLETPRRNKVREFISKAITENKKLKINTDDYVEINLENFTIHDEDVCDYMIVVSERLHDAEAVLSGGDLGPFPEIAHFGFTKDDFFQYLTLYSQITKFLDENVSDEFYVDDLFEYIRNFDLDQTMRDKIEEFGFDQTDEWKQCEKSMAKHRYSKEYLKLLEELEREDSASKTVKEVKERPPPRILVKRELASTIGITICSKCGSRTKMKSTEHLRRDNFEGVDVQKGYAICPKCGHKEGWLDGGDAFSG